MKIAPTLSSLAGTLCLVASVFFFFFNKTTQELGAELQKKQQQLQTEQQALQVEQQKFQNQQQQINAGVQLAQQVGPAVLNDLAVLARDNKNEKIKTLLGKYGLSVNEKPVASPAPANP
jgi:uncharacterized protein YlxW (UPF0749 family)